MSVPWQNCAIDKRSPILFPHFIYCPNLENFSIIFPCFPNYNGAPNLDPHIVASLVNQLVRSL